MDPIVKKMLEVQAQLDKEQRNINTKAMKYLIKWNGSLETHLGEEGTGRDEVTRYWGELWKTREQFEIEL